MPVQVQVDTTFNRTTDTLLIDPSIAIAPGAHFQTTGPEGHFNIDLVFSLLGRAFVELATADLYNDSFNLTYSNNLFEFGSALADKNVNQFQGSLVASIAWPHLNVSGTDTGSGASNPFFTATIDVDDVVFTALLGAGNASGVHDIETSSQAAEALRPIAGQFAFAMFAVGIIGTGMLAVPVLAGSAAYAVTEMAGIAGSLDAKPLSARLFYGTIAATTLAGASLSGVGIDPARALYWAAVGNGVLAGPLMVVMMLIVSNPRAMGRLTAPRRQLVFGWAATLVMIAASALFLGFIVAGAA